MMDTAEEIERKFRDRYDPATTRRNVEAHERKLDELKADLKRWQDMAAERPNDKNIAAKVKETEKEIGHEYTRLREADRRYMKSQMLLVDKQAEQAMLFDFNRIERDKSDVEFEERVRARNKQHRSE